MAQAYQTDRQGMSDNGVAVRLTFRLVGAKNVTQRIAQKMDLK